ncbi:MAG: lamin tail domain-containing protein [Salinarimonas sp.]
MHRRLALVRAGGGAVRHGAPGAGWAPFERFEAPDGDLALWRGEIAVGAAEALGALLAEEPWEAPASIRRTTVCRLRIAPPSHGRMLPRPGAGATPAPGGTVMSEAIYRRIWEADDERFSIATRNGDGTWTAAAADILLDEQVRASGKRHIDLATRPLFAAVNAEKLAASRQYQAFIALLDNYAVQFRDPEVTSPAERAEIAGFLDLVLASEPMGIAFDYVSTALVRGLTHDDFRVQLASMWFEPYTNFFNGRSTHFCSGFEHVFVGEGKYDRRHGATETKGEITGYHSWVKFHLDEAAGRVNFLGYKYDLNGAGPDVPHVVTLQMTWTHLDLQGALKAQLFKKKGGFFVGTSPACEMALATLAFYEATQGLLANQAKRVRFGTGLYDLVLYRSTLPDGARGLHVRSFFPKLVGAGLDVGGDEVVVHPVDPARDEDVQVGGLRVRISAVMPNPVGADEGRETATIVNAGTEPVDLAGWELRDKMGRPQPVPPQVLAPGAELVVVVTRATPEMMQMSNRRGVVTLHDASGDLVASLSYTRAEEGAVIAG